MQGLPLPGQLRCQWERQLDLYRRQLQMRGIGPAKRMPRLDCVSTPVAADLYCHYETCMGLSPCGMREPTGRGSPSFEADLGARMSALEAVECAPGAGQFQTAVLTMAGRLICS